MLVAADPALGIYLDGYHVHSIRGGSKAPFGQILIDSKGEMPEALRRDRLLRKTEGRGAAALDLHKDELGAVIGDQIDLAAAEAYIAVGDAESLA